MPGPEMVQLDPAQKQAPAAVEAFDRRQIILQAKQEVNLLLEKSKSVINTDKAKLENLQVISSFTVLAKPGHEKETYEIYRVEVSKVNEQLILNKESFDIQLEETSPGKLYIVCGRYEEREPKAAQTEEKVDEKRIAGPSVAQNENQANISPIDIAWLGLTKKECNDIIASPMEIKKASPIELTPKQWSVLEGKIFLTAKIAYEGKQFDGLTTEQKLDVIRRAISPDAAEGKEIGFTYRKAKDPLRDDMQKASETLSKLSGDCDDLAILYAACVKQLKKEGKLDVASVKLAVAGYYDPELKNATGHANIIQTTAGGKNTEPATFLVDMTFNTAAINLDIDPKIADAAGLKDKFVAHLNKYRTGKDEINAGMVELRVFEGEEGVQSYYRFKKGEYYEACGKSAEALPELTASIEMAEKSGLYRGDALVMRGRIYKELGGPMSLEGHELKLGGKKDEQAKADSLSKKGTEHFNAGENDYIAAYAQGNLSSFACIGEAKWFKTHGDYQKAEESAKQAINLAPFREDYYAELWTIYSQQNRYSEASETFKGFVARLKELCPENKGAVFELRKSLVEKIRSVDPAYVESP